MRPGPLASPDSAGQDAGWSAVQDRLAAASTLIRWVMWGRSWGSTMAWCTYLWPWVHSSCPPFRCSLFRFRGGERAANRCVNRRVEAGGNRRFRHHAIKTVKTAWRNVKLGRNTCVQQPTRVVDIFIRKQINRADPNKRRRQTLQFVYARRHSSCGHRLRARGHTQ